jgi:histidine triad (HIT) family protein
MPDESCIFCRIIGGEEMVSLVYEDDRAIAFLDIQPVSQGHTLIVSREHHATIFDLPDDLLAHCTSIAKRLARGLQRAVGAEAVNLFSANGKAGGQDVLHFHLHLIPIQEGQPFALQLPQEDAPIPMRSELDITAARINRAIQEIAGAPA